MDLTLHRRPDEPPRRALPALPVLVGPVGVLLAATLLAGAFLFAVSDLVARLG